MENKTIDKKSFNKDLVEANAKRYAKKTSSELEACVAEEALSAEDEKLVALKDDEEFLKALNNTADDKAAVKLFAEKGIEMSEEECHCIRQGIVDSITNLLTCTEEMSDDELAQVAGGSWLKKAWKKTKRVAVAAVMGAATSLAITGVIVAGTVFAPLAPGIAGVLAVAGMTGAISGGVGEGIRIGLEAANVI